MALGKGKTKITVSYGGLKRTINVKVLKEIDLLEEEGKYYKKHNMDNKSDDISVKSLTQTERDDIRDNALAMISYCWHPEGDLIGWKSRFIFEEDEGYSGIPYSQTPNQSDETLFDNALDDYETNNFYTPMYFYQDGVQYIQPRYGNDCSGFTSFSWGISRKTTLDFYNGIKNGTYPKVGSYNASTPTSPSKTDLKNSYELMQLGDAVVYRTSNNSAGHVFVIAVNFTNEDRVQCFEQTDPYCSITYWTYDQLVNKKYMPFSKE